MKRFAALLLCCCLAGAWQPAAAQDGNAAVRQLAEQARYWEQRDQPGRARDAWERVLAADPGNEEALGRLAALLEASGEPEQAAELADRLETLNPESRWLRGYREREAVDAVDPDLLAEARRLAGDDRPEAALDAYREAFDGAPPSAALSREYHEVLAGIPDQRAVALEQLETLEAGNPGDPRFTLARARVQTYDEAARRTGIRSLADLYERNMLREQAGRAWRQALIWLDARTADLPLFDRYLEAVGRDDTIAAKRAGLVQQRPDPRQAERDAAIRAGFSALDEGRLDDAEQHFAGVLENKPRNADALGGLGLVRLRRDQLEPALELLEQAMRAQPGTASRWREAARSARFFLRFRSAQDALEQDDDAIAVQRFRQAFAEAPADADPTLRLPYAEALLRIGDVDEAEAMARAILEARPGNADATALLARILIQTDRLDEAERLAAGGPPDVAAAVAPARARALRERAAEADAAGQRDRAQRLLREAIALDPDSPWPRLDLARILRDTGQPDAADQLIEGLVQSHPDLPEVTIAQTYALADAGRWLEVLRTLETLPAHARDQDARTLQRRAWVQYQVERAGIARRAGDFALAFEAMSKADAAAAENPEFAGLLAGGWADLGDPARALGYLRRAFADQPGSIGERLQYAGLLLELGQRAEFEAQAEYLLRQDLSPAQSAQLEDLVVGFRINLADRARQHGDLAEAYEVMRDVVRRRPRESRVQMALARIFEAAGDHDEALAIYEGLLTDSPDPEPDLVDARINALLAAGELEAAEAAIADARDARPEDAALDTFSARLAEARGNQGRALRYYERAADRRARQPDGDAFLRPPRLATISEADSAQPLLPRPVRDAMEGRNPDAPERVLRPRPGPFSRPVPPADEAVDGNAVPQSLRSSSSLRRSEPRPVAPAPDDTRDSVRLRAADRLTRAPREASAPSEAPARAAISDPDDPERSRRRAISRLRASTSGWAGGGLHSRVRDGEGGLSRLFNIETPFELQSSATSAGRFGLRVVPVIIDGGEVEGDRRLRFGTLALIEGGPDDLDLAQQDSGIAAGVTYQMGSFHADIGSTPLGFAEERLSGGLYWGPSFGRWKLDLSLSRRPVSDSVLSYAGTRDPLSGVNFGAVNRSKARVDLAYDLDSFGIYVNGGFSYYDGRNTDDNNAFELGGGAYFRALRARSLALTYGINITTFFYDKNRRHFTLGHGGYFSPQTFLSVGVPVELTGHHDRMVWRINGAVGLQSFEEDGAPLFPNNADLQDQIEDLIDINPDSALVGGYASGSQSGLGYAFGGSLEYRLSSRFFVGGAIASDNARDYTEYQFSGFLRYFFGEQIGVPDAPRLLPAYYNWSGS